MPDRENVINRMETICNICKENTWHTEFSSDTIYPLLRDALAMLKEREAKPVSQIRTIAYRTIGYCPSCGRGLDSYEDGNSGDHITKYCYNCGQAVKWE